MLVIAIVAVGVAVAVVAVRDDEASKPVPAATEQTSEAGISALGNDAKCDTVIQQCVARAELKLPRCERELAQSQITELLSLPQNAPACKQARVQMEKNCTPGCELDFSSIVVVPGEVKLKFISAIDEAGQCLAKGAREVTLSAVCRRAPTK